MKPYGLAWWSLGGALLAQDLAMFEAGKVTVGSQSYPYRLLVPAGQPPAAGWPLVVFLHGAGERGDDNERQLTWLARPMAQEPLRSRFPCFLLAVQCPKDAMWVERPWAAPESTPMAGAPAAPLQAVVAAMDQLADRPIDPDRVYLTGLSMGGYGSWELAMRMPGRFAAVVPVCGGGDERRAFALFGLPVQVWHGAADKVVPARRSQQLVTRLQELGVDVQYHELPGVGHDSWKQAYTEDGALGWLFAQRRQPVPQPVLVRGAGLRPAGDGSALVPARGDVAAPSALAALAAFAGTEWRAATGLPGTVVPAEADAGLRLRLDPELPVPWRLDLGDDVVAVGRSPRAVADALAALLSLQASSGLAKGTWEGRPASTTRYVLTIAGDAPDADAMATIVRSCWLAGIDALQPATDPAAGSTAPAWAALAGTLGIELVGSGAVIDGGPWGAVHHVRWSGGARQLPSVGAILTEWPSTNAAIDTLHLTVAVAEPSLPRALPARLLAARTGLSAVLVRSLGMLPWR